MVKKGKELELECVAVHETKRYRKYKLPSELFDDEEAVVLFSGKHIYVHKGDEGEGVEQIVIVLCSTEGE